MILLFNGSCGFCTNLARRISSSSRGKIEVTSLQSDRAKNLLSDFYPNGAKFTFYLIDLEGSTKKCYSGYKAGIQLFRMLPISKFLLFLGIYLDHEMRSRRRKLVSEKGIKSEIDLGRRGFVKTLALIPFLFVLPRLPVPIVLGTKFSMAGSRAVLSSATKDKLIAAIGERIRDGRPSSGYVTIDEPECVAEPCQCTSQTYCCFCGPSTEGGQIVCVAVCQDGCGGRYNTFVCTDANGNYCYCSSDSDCIGGLCSCDA